MTTSTNASTYRLFVGIDIAAISAKVSWLVPAGKPTRAITMEQTPQAFSALQLRLLSTGHQARSILVVMEATGSRLHQPRYHPDAGRLCRECDQPGASPSFCQGLTQAGQD